MDAGLIDEQPVSPLAHLLLGAMDEGAMLIARADDDGRTREEVGASLERFLQALGTAPISGALRNPRPGKFTTRTRLGYRLNTTALQAGPSFRSAALLCH